MVSRFVIGGLAFLALAAGGAGYFVYEDVKATDAAIATELDFLTTRQRFMDADILDGQTDLHYYEPVMEQGPRLIAAIREAHPIGSLIRATGIRRLEDGYAAMRLNYETYNESQD